jgi:methyltransferase (TIGR00027 family)
VCTGRALAHERATSPRFSDPTALALLNEEERALLEKLRADPASQKDFRSRMRAKYLRALATIMVARTVSIDDAVRAAHARQVVILGAGLDGRAWRMRELKDAIVFEVDHPDSQREKIARIERAQLKPTAGEVRFVPVDFTRDSLDAALAQAGHDASAPTKWIWEGVVMYLTPAQIDATLEVVRARSAPSSPLAVVYHSPALILVVIRFFLRRVGEPLRSAFTPEQMGAVLARHGFRVTSDSSMAEIARTLGLDAGRKLGYGAHIRAVFAVRE